MPGIIILPSGSAKRTTVSQNQIPGRLVLIKVNRKATYTIFKSSLFVFKSFSLKDVPRDIFEIIVIKYFWNWFSLFMSTGGLWWWRDRKWMWPRCRRWWSLSENQLRKLYSREYIMLWFIQTCMTFWKKMEHNRTLLLFHSDNVQACSRCLSTLPRQLGLWHGEGQYFT